MADYHDRRSAHRLLSGRHLLGRRGQARRWAYGLLQPFNGLVLDFGAGAFGYHGYFTRLLVPGVGRAQRQEDLWSIFQRSAIYHHGRTHHRYRRGKITVKWRVWFIFR